MKFPSFIKTTKYSKFNFEPRYYDPVKEEIEGKLKAARLKYQNGSDNNGSEAYSSSISSAFSKREKRTNQTSILQLIIAAALMSTVVGWIFFGNDILYVFLVLSPLYFYFRIKKRKKNS